ncbi:hypothetical protein [Teredinibacter sp. KSP-S5-2]|uniref:hypothetical protein n=1 Tax=Teredinibacter sp. KSP-S5-2 TaxID=3034506 RepID=UPI0029346411|nr:hypothetical protein [Teredinibacter sp. KSP-S5-2]WNO10099.1 hypothetical protein P5V12_02835 [Teredinibacter sp. KSP-S5-2]
MAFLCNKHLGIVKSNPCLGMKLWSGAFANGERSYQHSRWKPASAFFGAAYEISLECMYHKSTQFDPLHFSAAGQCLVNSLCQLGELPTAYDYLKEMKSKLRVMSSSIQLHPDNQRIAAKLVGHIQCQLTHVAQVKSRLSVSEESGLVNEEYLPAGINH